MPIHNFIGTGTEDIGKAHIYTGSGFDQISKVHYYDGTDYQPIYSANMLLYDGGMKVKWTPFKYNAGNGTTTDNGTSLSANCPTASSGTTVTRICGWYTDAMDISGYNTLSVNFSSVFTNSTTCDYVFAAVLKDPTATNYPYNPDNKGTDYTLTTADMVAAGFDTDNIVAMYGVAAGKDYGAQNWVIDLSNVGGEYHVGVYAVKRYDQGRIARFTMTYANIE